MVERSERDGWRPWTRAALSLVLLLAGVGSLAWASLVAAPAPAGAAVDSSSTVGPPLTTPKTTASTPPSSSATTTPKTTRTTRTSVPATTTPATGPPATRGVVPTPSYTYVTSTSTSTSTTSTTLASIAGQAQPVATVPLVTKASNGHVNPALAWISGAAMAVALIMVGWRLFVTRPGGADRAPLETGTS